jgi:uncharacterized membrane protein
MRPWSAGRKEGSGPSSPRIHTRCPNWARSVGTAGVLSGSLDAGGIDEEFIKRVGEEVTEGTSALFALTSGAADRERVVEEMRAQENFEIIWTDMPEEELRELREAFVG